MQNEEKHTPKYISVDIKHSGKRRRECKNPVSQLDSFITTPIRATTIEGVLEGEYNKIEDPHCDLDVIHDNPAGLTCEYDGEGVCDTVYSDSLQPSMFAKPPEQHSRRKRRSLLITGLKMLTNW